MTESEAPENWFSRGKAEAAKNVPINERVTGVVIVLFSSLMILYFLAHQIRATGFFTSSFSNFEMIMLYGSLFFWIVTASLDGVLGQRLLSRLIDTFGGIIFITVAAAWLLIVFPFEFVYFGEVLPVSLRFLVQWVSNFVARVLMLLYTIVMAVAAIYAPIAYGFIGKKGSKRVE